MNKDRTRTQAALPAASALAGILLALAALLGGCRREGPASANGFSPRYGSDRQDSLYIAGHYTNFEALETEFDRFKEYYPQVDIRYEFLDNYNATILPALRGDDPPDIYFTFSWMLDKENYRPLFDKAENLAYPQLGLDYGCIQQGSVVRGKESGRVAMLPIVATSYGMLVNEDLFRKLSMAIPKTYGELKDCCARLKEAGYGTPVIGDCTHEQGLYSSLALPYFCSSISGREEAISRLNALAPGSGEYLRDLLDFIADFAGTGAVDRDLCAGITNNNEIIFRFFEGDIPMAVCAAETVSSTKKRERISEAFMAAPFSYGFYPVPTDRGRIFLKMAAIDISVNKDSRNLDMANEFLRFLISTGELNMLSKQKRLITVTGDYGFDDIYAPFADADQFLNFDEIGIMDNAIVQMRRAVNAVARGELSRDEAVAAFGSF